MRILNYAQTRTYQGTLRAPVHSMMKVSNKCEAVSQIIIFFIIVDTIEALFDLIINPGNIRSIGLLPCKLKI